MCISFSCPETLYINYALCRSNALFNVWNSYAGKLPAAFYTAQLLATGDLLYKKGFYRLAKVHCYGRYLSSSGVDWNDDLVEHLRDTNIKDISSTVSDNYNIWSESTFQWCDNISVLCFNILTAPCSCEQPLVMSFASSIWQKREIPQ